MVCDRCSQEDRVPVRRAKTAERDRKVAVVIEVPMEECPSCGDRWMTWDASRRLDELHRSMLDSDAELAARHFDSTDSAA
jgi:YgiT-type zinc finger domain-containing protein